ncbi:hypothetical protein [Aphanizomenon flos-aquae]|uniref:hypothetical protein n=1 Tax=Aphanizomenon flos-aquae TaxID=1176 RepID=UPI0012699350|nr:hypothetical protein [Aphanizomenon flos-aquae]
MRSLSTLYQIMRSPPNATLGWVEERNPTKSLVMLGFAVAQPNLHFLNYISLTDKYWIASNSTPEMRSLSTLHQIMRSLFSVYI